MRIWSHGQDRTHSSFSCRSGSIAPIGQGSQHAQKVVWRAQIVLAAGDGMGSVAIAATVGKSVLTVRRAPRRRA